VAKVIWWRPHRISLWGNRDLHLRTGPWSVQPFRRMTNWQTHRVTGTLFAVVRVSCTRCGIKSGHDKNCSAVVGMGIPVGISMAMGYVMNPHVVILWGFLNRRERKTNSTSAIKLSRSANVWISPNSRMFSLFYVFSGFQRIRGFFKMICAI